MVTPCTGVLKTSNTNKEFVLRTGTILKNPWCKQSFIFAIDPELACFLRVTFPEHLGQEAVEQVGITDLKFSILCWMLNTIIAYYYKFYITIDCYFSGWFFVV